MEFSDLKESPKYIGIVKFFDKRKGFGYVASNNCRMDTPVYEQDFYVDENSHPYNMELKANGKFSQDFGAGFLDEADNEAIRLFDLSNE